MRQVSQAAQHASPATQVEEAPMHGQVIGDVGVVGVQPALAPLLRWSPEGQQVEEAKRRLEHGELGPSFSDSPAQKQKQAEEARRLLDHARSATEQLLSMSGVCVCVFVCVCVCVRVCVCVNCKCVYVNV